MDLTGFQRELWEKHDDLLHGPSELLVAAWNMSADRALDRITPMWSLLAHCFHYSPWFTEKDQEMPREPLEENKSDLS